MIVGGVLVFIGLAFLVEWLWDKRKVLPPLEYAVVVVVLRRDHRRGFKEGVVIGLVLAVVLFAISYGRIELVREVAFGETYRIQRRSAGERTRRAAWAFGPGPDPAGERVRVLRVDEPPARACPPRVEEATPPRFLVIICGASRAWTPRRSSRS